MYFSLCLHSYAEEDLEGLWQTHEEVAAQITVLLEQVKGDQKLLDALTIHDYGSWESEQFHVQPWINQRRRGRNLWRLKVWDLENRGLKYRVIYALDPRISRYHVLAVVERNFNYDESDPRTRRILEAYNELGIPDY